MKKDIYIIKNTINNKVYIGQAKNAAERWLKHISAANKGYNYVISKAMKKYGIDKFYYQILESQISNYDEREKYWIKYYNSRTPNGYNVAPGGNSVGNGIENPNSYFDSIEDILVIIDILQHTNYTITNIAKQFGCSEYVISQINLGSTYRQEGIDYPIRKTRYDKELIKQIHYSLQYELDKSMNQIAKEYKIDRSQLDEINAGRLHQLPGKKYPLREGRAFSINKKFVNEIKRLLKDSSLQQKDIAKQFNVSCSFISSINKGIYYYDSSEVYPLRDNYQANIKNRVCLSPKEISEIELLLKNSKISLRKIAEQYEISYQSIVNINNGTIIKYYDPNIIYPIRKIQK